MVKVSNEEERINPLRKRRLRKKLHVSEFKEAGLELLISGLTSREVDDDNIDNFLDKAERLAKKYGWKSGYSLFSNDFSSIFYININELELEKNGGSDRFVKELIDVTKYSITLEHVEDAHYPDEDHY